MSVPELKWRAQGALRAGGERARLRLGLPNGGPPLERIADPALAGEALLFGQRPPAFLPGEGQSREGLASALGAAGSASAADSASPDGSASPAGASTPAVEAIPDWNRDPLTGRSFPLGHWSSIDYRRPADAEAIRRLWYQGRQRFLPDVALPYYLAGDHRAAVQAAELLRSWIEQCPPGRGIHWLVPLELALRLIAWSYTARLLAGSEALALLAPALARSVHLQAEHILRHLSRHSSANNHLIGQAAGLFHAGVAFAGLRRAAVWRETGREIFWREILRQTTEDGVSREGSTHYHELVVELAVLVWLVLRAANEGPPPAAEKRLTAMLDFVAELESFPGGPPDAGDSDNQSALPFSDPTSSRQTLLVIGAVLCGRGDWKGLTRAQTRRAALLLGAAGRAEYEALPRTRPVPVSRIYPEAGCAILRDATGDRAIWFDFGELGYLSTAAHAHADCLSIALGAFGQSMLVDPGTYTYHAEPMLRDFFRSTAAHNTVRVDGEEQSEMRGAFLWGRRAHGRLIEWASRPAIDWVTAEHDGYGRLRSPVRHRRTVVFVKPDYLWVLDELAGEGEHLLEQFLHLGEAVVSRGPEPGEVFARAATGAELRILVLGEPRPEIDLLSGCQRPLQGWVSPMFGERRPEVVWRRVASRPLPAILQLLLRPLAGGGLAEDREPVVCALHRLDSGQTLSEHAHSGHAHSEHARSGHALHVRGMPGEDLVCLAGGGGSEGGRSDGRPARGVVPGEGILAGSVEIDGRFALVRWGEGGPRAIAGQRLRRLVAGGRVLVEVEGEPADFCLRRLGDQAVVEGSGGRVRVWGDGIREVRSGGLPLAAERSGDWIGFTLGPGASAAAVL